MAYTLVRWDAHLNNIDCSSISYLIRETWLSIIEVVPSDNIIKIKIQGDHYSWSCRPFSAGKIGGQIHHKGRDMYVVQNTVKWQYLILPAIKPRSFSAVLPDILYLSKLTWLIDFHMYCFRRRNNYRQYLIRTTVNLRRLSVATRAYILLHTHALCG